MGAYQQAAAQIVEAIGGKENIVAATHCVTRLRFALKEEGKVNKEALERIDVVKGSFSANGQFQVVIGQGLVDKVYDDLIELTGIGRATKQEIKDAAEAKLNPLQRAIKTLADIFIPILPAIVTAGLLMGINNVLTGPGIFYEGKSFVEVHKEWADLANMINLIANTAFVFLPGLIGWSAVTKFGGSPLLGIVLGLMLVHPDLLNAWGWGAAKEKGEIPVWNLFGFEVQKVGYQGQVLPVLVASYVLAKLELFLRKRIPDAFQLLLVAPLALLITGFLAFIAIGPITFAIGNAITHLFVTIFDTVPALGGLLYGALYAPLVVTGMHHTFLPVDLQLIANTGGTFLWPILVMSNIAQGSAALAMMFVAKEEKLRGLSFTSAVSAYLGITEPAMFGVNLRFRFPFIAAMTGAAIAGMFITINKVMAPSIGVGGLPGFLSIVPQKWTPFFIGMAIAIAVPFALTFVFGKVRKAARS
ncbi:PTS system trehalose-specific EIIBC component [Geobacillus sp. G4]|uniref:protein-N(pi)-phosphohistidine--sucrose phosphotransferase n=5 Tax=Geobacillus thermoleovorans group TaxID=1505648 RepID=Q5KZ54_GEOKA|nr:MULTISPECIES: PTS system trehalose-specific EIIBC component [Geobacillus]AEV19333.1 Trehalose permease IIC component [Geobacillus thermoleovorans CCB_US3_UF5]AMV10940.1 trehalose permease IIC protein [Geobacillus thermoleovorans]AUI35362.1 PTS trehalose transporter subunit IIBC [[Bacillus] caldolyticus]AWO76039.1 PTS trehalose transporter subunit IIBC [Geobacillus thermoleovorans]EQB96944.1 trehalose permease IIC protein [Geobacillus sp. A8]